MTLRVLLFASWAEAIGAPEVQVDVPEHACVGDVLARVRTLTGGRRIPDAPLVAVNQRYASLDETVTARDEIAIIPPVAGG